MSLVELRNKGLSIREVARVTGYSRNTVRKWLRSGTLPAASRSRRRQGPSKLDPYKAYLVRRLGEGVTSSPRLLREVVAQGYTGKVTILKDFLKPFRVALAPRATARFETAPGEQAQVDFAEFAYLEGEARRKVWAFVMVLSFSRLLYVEFVEGQDLGTLLRCHQNAFEFFGGVPQKVLYDNMKAAVVGRDASGQPRWNQRFLDFARLFGFTPAACWPYRAQTKGKVERAIGYIRTGFWPVAFSDLADLNRQAMAWVNGVANLRLHGTTGERPVDRFKREELQPVAPRVLAEHLADEERQVGPDGFVSYRGSRYGVSWRFAGRTVRVRVKAGVVELWLGERKLGSHKLAPAGATVPVARQWDELPLVSSRPRARPVGVKLPDPAVEVRSLLAYEAAAGGDAG